MKKLFFLIFCTIFLIGFVSSADWDNVKSYDKDTQTVTIKNLFGLGKDYAEIRLNTPLLVKTGFGGEFKVAEFEVRSLSDYNGALSGMRFYNVKDNMKEIERDFTYKVLSYKEVEINDYEYFCNVLKNGTENCGRTIVGSHKEQVEVWNELGKTDFLTDEIKTIGIFTYVYEGDYVEWIPTYYGVKIDEWAGWTTDLDTNLLVYWKFNETSGDIKDFVGNVNLSPVGTPTYNLDGIIGGAVWTDASSDWFNDNVADVSAFSYDATEDLTISFWVNSSDYDEIGPPYTTAESRLMQTTATFTGGIDLGGQATNKLNTFISGISVYCDAMPLNEWVMVTRVRNNSGEDHYLFINGVINRTALGQATASSTATNITIGDNRNDRRPNQWLDEYALWDRALTPAEITRLYNEGSGITWGEYEINNPSVTLNNPTDYENFTTNIIIFDTDVYTYYNDMDIANVSLYIDGILNETNTSSINGTYQFEKILSDNEHNYSILSYGNNSFANQSSTRTFWINTTPELTLTAPINYTNSTIGRVIFNATLGTNSSIASVGFWINGSLNESNTSGVTGAYQFDKILADGLYYWNINATSGNGAVNNSETRMITIDSSAPAVTISNPPSVVPFQAKNYNLSLNWTATDQNLDKCIIYYDTVNTTVTCSDNYYWFNITSPTQSKTLIFYVNDTFGNMNYTNVTWNYRLFLVSETYDTTATEGASSTFSANFLTNGSAITIANLSYNAGTNIGTITNHGGDNYTVSETITVPAVSTDTNISFFWNITQGNFNYALSSKNQTVSTINLDNCTTNTIVLYNFTIVDEDTQTQISQDNTTGLLDLTFYAFGTMNEVANITRSYDGVNSFTVCINSSLSSNYRMDGIVEYDGDEYVKEFYNFQNETVSSTTRENITLRNLNESLSQEFKIVARGTDYLPLKNTLIKIYRKYVAEGIDKITEIPLTDYNGEAVAHLIVNDVLYTYQIVQNGTILATFSNQPAICQTPLVTTCIINLDTIISDIVLPDFEDDLDFTYTLDYNETSRVISSTFYTGSPATMTLTVIREDALGTAVCTDTLTSDSGTLSCVIPNSFGNSTVTGIIKRDSVEVARGSVKLDQSPSDIYGEVLVFLGLFVMFTLIGASISNSPVYTILFFMLGVIFLFAINLVSNNGFIGGSATILWLIIAIIIVVIKGARRNN